MKSISALSTSVVDFWLKRAMSFLGLVPLGIYTIAHLWTNLSSLGGPCLFDAALLASRRHPAFLILEILLGLAILLHVVVGVRLMLNWRPSQRNTKSLHGLKFLLQRLSGIGLLLFLVAHIINARIMPVLKGRGHEDFFGMRHAFQHDPATLPVYILGLLGISFHLANGLWTFLLTWGITVTPSAQRKSQWISILFFVALLVMSGLVLYGFLQPAQTSWAACQAS